MKLKRIKCGLLIFDFTLYPRAAVDATHVRQLADVLRASAELPPVLVEEKTLRIIDGFHRTKAYLTVHGPDFVVDYITKSYASDGELLLDAIRLNAPHGRRMSSHDRVTAALRAQEYDITLEQVAEVMSLTLDRLEQIIDGASAETHQGNRVAIKRTIEQFARDGKKLTKKQQTVIPKLGGMRQTFYANQIILLAENGMIDTENAVLKQRIELLGELIPNIAWAV